MAVRDVARDLGVAGRLAVETASFAQLLAEAMGRETCAIDAALARARAIKTDDEIARLERAAEVAAIGQRPGRDLAAAGGSELELFAGTRLAMERAVGQRSPLTGGLVSGIEPTASMGGWPTERLLQRGDPIICDLAPRVDGYWGDSCGSFCLGEASRRYLDLFAAAREALAMAEAEIRPGLRASQLDAMLRDVVRSKGFSYQHHSGHSIGTAVHEYPRIVPYEMASIEENMVMMIEPGAYLP